MVGGSDLVLDADRVGIRAPVGINGKIEGAAGDFLRQLPIEYHMSGVARSRTLLTFVKSIASSAVISGKRSMTVTNIGAGFSGLAGCRATTTGAVGPAATATDASGAAACGACVVVVAPPPPPNRYGLPLITQLATSVANKTAATLRERKI